MTGGTFHWMTQEIPFREGETIAAALAAQGIQSFGPDASGQETRFFCGIGACQCCLVKVAGCVTEACLTPARSGLRVERLVGNDV